MISKIFSSLTYDFYKSNPITKLNFIKNINGFLPDNIIDQFENHNWNLVPTRNFDTIKNFVESNNKDFVNLSHFNHFVSTNICQWKITNYSTIIGNDDFINFLNSKFIKYKVWVTQIPPGCCIPNHIDTVDEFIESNNIDKSNIMKIKRYLILPEDIKPWHHLWYGNTILSTGLKGDMYEFDFWLAHGGGNLGPTNKYTIQIMAI